MAEAASAQQAASATEEDTSQQRAGRRRRTSPEPQRAQQGVPAAAAPAALDTLSRLQQLADASPQVAQLRRLQALVEASPQVAQLRRLQALADASPQAAQLRRLQALADAAAGVPSPTDTVEAAPPNRTGLPDGLKAGVESLSGLSMDHVRVHYNSAQPEQLNALAYAQGSDIHLAPGQEQHLPHEAWHVVQQAQGRVKPTLQMKDGVPVNDDVWLEREADVIGPKALEGGLRADETHRSMSMPIETAWLIEGYATNSPGVSVASNHSAALTNGRGSAQRGENEVQTMADQRPEVALQRQVQAWVDGSERVGQLRAWQGVADGRGLGGKRQDLTPGFVTPGFPGFETPGFVQMKDRVPVNDDAGLERETAVMGAKAAIAVNMSEPSGIFRRGAESAEAHSELEPNSGQGKKGRLNSPSPVQRVLKVPNEKEKENESEEPKGGLELKEEEKGSRDLVLDTVNPIRHLFIGCSPVIAGSEEKQLFGMVESSIDYTASDSNELAEEMKKYSEKDDAVTNEINFIKKAQPSAIQNRHASRPPIPNSQWTQERINALIEFQTRAYEDGLREDISYSGVYFRQLEAIKNQGNEHIPKGLRPVSILDHVEIMTTVKREGEKSIDDVTDEEFFDGHPRITRIINPHAHQFLRDQFMQAKTPEGKSVILQNPNMAFNPKMADSINRREKYKTNEKALERILGQIKGVMAPKMKEILPLLGGQDTHASFGNFLPVPATEKLPHGSLLVGGNENGELSLTQRMILNLFDTHVEVINTSWLRVGHTDEIISIVPWKESLLGFKVLVADQKIMGHGDEKITNLLDQIAKQLGKVFGDDNIVRVPGLYERYDTTQEYRNENPLAHYLGNSTTSEESKKYVSAFPNMINMMVLNDHPFKGIDTHRSYFFDENVDTSGKITLIVPDPTCKRGVINSRAKEEFAKIMKPSGNEVKFVDDLVYNINFGDMHCATFELRRDR